MIMRSFRSKRLSILLAIACFSLLLAMRMDRFIVCSYWFTFLPLWLWKFVGCLDCLLNLVFYHDRRMIDQKVGRFSIVFSLIYQLCLLSFELLLCAKLENFAVGNWSITFSPLFILCLLGAFKSVWDGKAGHTFDLELFVSVNVFTFIFIALRLDTVVQWSWTVVLIPLWVIMGILSVIELYALLSAAMSYDSRQLTYKERRFVQTTSILYAFVLFPLFGFFIILVRKLEGYVFLSNVVVAIPMFFVLCALMLMTFFGEVNENRWFGMRRALFEILLDYFPMLQKYVNINYNGPVLDSRNSPLHAVQNPGYSGSSIDANNAVPCPPTSPIRVTQPKQQAADGARISNEAAGSQRPLEAPPAYKEVMGVLNAVCSPMQTLGFPD